MNEERTLTMEAEEFDRFIIASMFGTPAEEVPRAQGYVEELRARVADLEAAQQQVIALANEMGDGVSPECSGFAEKVLGVLARGTSTPADAYEQIGGVCRGCSAFIRTDGMVPSQHQFGHVIPGELPDFCGPVDPVYVAAAPEGSGT